MPLPSIGGGSGRGVFVYKNVANHSSLPISDLNYLKDQYNKGAIALVYDQGDSNFYRYEDVNGVWTWNQRDNFATGKTGATGATGTNGVGITSITFKEVDAHGNNVYEMHLSDGSTFDFKAPKGTDGAGDSHDLIKLFGNPSDPKAGRVRYDENTKHWVFEVKDDKGDFVNKLEVGGSIIVDVIRLIGGQKPTNIPTNEMALYLAPVNIGGVQQIRPYWVLPNGDEFGVVTHDEQTGDIVYRQKDGQLGKLVPKQTIIDIKTLAESNVHHLDYSDASHQLKAYNHDGTAIDVADLSSLATGGGEKVGTLAKVMDNGNSTDDNDLDMNYNMIENLDQIQFEKVGESTKWANISYDGSELELVVVDGMLSSPITFSTNGIKSIFNGVNLTSSGDGTQFLTNNGTYKTINAISTDKKIYDYRSKKLPTDLNDDNTIDEYYITMLGLPSQNLELATPNPSGNIKDGTIFCLESNASTKVMYITPADGYTINGKTVKYKVRPNTLNYFVKNGYDWNLAFSGYLPANLSSLVDDLKGKLGILTMDEIEQDLLNRGFEKNQDTIKYGYVDGVPSDETGLTNLANADEDVTIAPTNQGSKYLAILIPDFMHPLVKDLVVNGQTEEPRVYGIVIGDDNFKILVSPTAVNTDAQVTFNLGYGDSTVTTSGIELDDGISNVADIRKINLSGIEITKSDVQNEVDINSVTDWSNMNNDPGGKTNAVMVEEPLQAYIDPNSPTGQDRIKLRLKHGYYEFKWSAGYLAYANYNTEVIGKVNNSVKTGKIWFDDVAVSGGTYVYEDRNDKTIAIQETDMLDPNVTGGTDFLCAYRTAFKGTAPNDGYIKIYLRDKQTQQIINDVNGNPFEIKKVYKSGDTLGYLEMISVINAKGIKYLEMMIEDNFTNDTLVIEDRTQGISGIMVQALSSKGKTGKALLDYEVTTMQSIDFTHHYMGESLITIDYIVKQNQPIAVGTPGKGMTMADGFHLYNPTSLKFGIENNHLTFEDDGTNMAYFNFGKIINAEQTQLLKGKQINIEATLTDKNDAYNIQLVKWNGLPNEYTDKIITGISNTTPIMETNWVLDTNNKIFIPENIVLGDHKITGTFTVPTDCTNFAIIIYPNEQQTPLTLKLKEFTTNVKTPFNGWVVHSPHLIGEEHLRYSDKYLKTGMNSEGYASLRFTIDALPTKMPVGYKVKGNANIITNEIWQVGVKPKGEGVFQFNSDGIASISTTVRVKRGESAVGDQVLTFEYRKKVRNLDKTTFDEADYDRIDNSLFTHTIKETDTDFMYVTQPSFKAQVNAGDLIGLWLHTDVDDGAFLQSNGANQDLVSIVIDFDEITEDEAEILENIREIRFTQKAKDAGVYLQVDYDVDSGKPSISPIVP